MCIRGKRIEVGLSAFNAVIDKKRYFVDKTRFIKEIVNSAHVSLITRPRRFGKTLTMSMLKCFLEMNYQNPSDRSRHYSLFDGLDISKDSDFCDKNMGRWPVIAITFRGIEGKNFERAFGLLKDLLVETAHKYYFLKESINLTQEERRRYLEILSLNELSGESAYRVTVKALSTLESLLAAHCGRSVFLLIDEYDVPLQKARTGHYYDEMLELIRGMFGMAFKDAEFLEAAVLTGCLRLAKESIFTGTNNFRTFDVSNPAMGGMLGFTEGEVKDILKDFGILSQADIVREHYDGYRFGNQEIYCPWDVMNYCADAVQNAQAKPKNYWNDTSGNDIIREFFDYADDENYLEKVGALLKGDFVSARVDEQISFVELNRKHSIDQFLSILYSTGYLTNVGYTEDGLGLLKIPNKEIHDCFERQIGIYFSAENNRYVADAENLFKALLKGAAGEAEDILNWYLRRYVSVRDAGGESFYHGFTLGLLSSGKPSQGRGSLTSNKESGDGFSDILFTDGRNSTGVILELKRAASSEPADLLKSCDVALEQIERKRYADAMMSYDTVRCFGIAFAGKTCMVKLKR